MPYLAEARIEIDVAPEVAFDTLADHRAWRDWMPRSFVVASPADTPHHLGKRFAIRVAGLPVPSWIEITTFERPRTLAWSGGPRGLLHGHHEFRLTSNGKGGTLVHSCETWSGVLARLLRPLVKPAAERIGGEQLAGLASACRRAKG
jgi:hypothetical protein